MELAHRLRVAYSALQRSHADSVDGLGHAREVFAVADSLEGLMGFSAVWRFYRATGAASIGEFLVRNAARSTACADARAARAMADTLRWHMPADDLTNSPAITGLVMRSIALDSATAAQVEQFCRGAPSSRHPLSNDALQLTGWRAGLDRATCGLQHQAWMLALIRPAA